MSWSCRRMLHGLYATFLLTGLLLPSATAQAADDDSELGKVPGLFLSVLVGDAGGRALGLTWIDENWEPGFVPLALETLRFTQDPIARFKLVEILSRHTGQDFGLDQRKWQHWMWNQATPPHAEYLDFKRVLYGLFTPVFAGYFAKGRAYRIAPHEVVWGGVAQDGIPPLRSPKMLPAAQAEYLADEHVVFGIEVNGDARAYPNRILAWHEMFVDRVGGEPVAGVYCTLCGTVILYRTTHAGVEHALGTSGFLYRSNKLMYDKASQSLWSTMRGEPVIGPLVGKGIRLERLSVVTTTWGAWRRRHPQTTVLSLDTGHERDYAEGAAYRAYFATDDLMFPVPQTDTRLANKAPVLALLAVDGTDPLAIASTYLREHPVHRDRVGDVDLVVLTDGSGAHRVYEAGAVRFVSWDGDRFVEDASGGRWRVDESALHGPGGIEHVRMPSHNAFWFGWHAAFPGTRLVR